MSTDLCFADFAGNWRIHRRIDDRRSDAEGVFDGEGVFSPETDGALSYHESGTLSLGDIASMTSEQRYRWYDDGDSIAVYFGDGRFFHSFVLDGRADASHFCDPDHYDVSYNFTGWPVWTSKWTVRGPRKDYTMLSTFSRS